jgi:AhpD family alkylhydroperoxidase
MMLHTQGLTVPYWKYALGFRNARITPKVREQVIVRVGAVADCEYQLVQHKSEALRTGTSHELLANLINPQQHEFDDAALTALVRYVDSLVTNLRRQQGRRDLRVHVLRVTATDHRGVREPRLGTGDQMKSESTPEGTSPRPACRWHCRGIADSGVRVLARARLSELIQLREVDHDRVRVRTGDNPDGRALGGRVDLLVHRVRRDENEVSRTRLNDVFQTLAPPVPGGAFDYVQDRFLIAVVVRAGRRAR